MKRILEGLPNVHLIPPQGYIPFIFLIKKAEIILTDSGGVQEEAPSLDKPVLIMRNTTERPEGVEAGTSKLVGTDSEMINSQVELLLNDSAEYNKMASELNPYGDGSASEKIYNFVLSQYQK